ncbi:MAG TPA: YheC/YheD family protein [Syntrophomonas sp.]|nr:YheC/YheD family protein [Syntrophomonas sp.]HRW12482.1 YheC/YheD family protein [Syntrophomonas sp.]
MQADAHIRLIGNARLPVDTLAFSEDCSSRLAKFAAENLVLYLGQSHAGFKLVTDPGLSAGTVKMNPTLMHSYGLHSNLSYAIAHQRKGIRLGPYIGISANFQPDKNKPFGKQSLFIRQLIEQAQSMGAICFAFRPQDVNFGQASIKGYTCQGYQWKKRLYPLPDVIYPRCHSGITQQAMRQKLSNRGVRFLNPPGIGKWGTYKALRFNSRLHDYLPYTCPINHPADLKAMLNKYSCVYLKPITGSQGKNIIRINHQPRGSGYEYQYRIQQRQIHGTAASLEKLVQDLRCLLNNRRYLVQQQIDLLHLDGCIMDLRVMVQKNRSGSWIITGKVFRIGEPGSITSNISGGGRVGKAQQMLEKFFAPTKVREILVQIDFLALETARTMETRLGPIGELGIDIGVDKNAMVWLIEANLKPARSIFNLLEDYETRILSVRRPIEYAFFMAGF